MNRKEYENNCFSPNWIEIDLNEIKKQEKNSSLNRTQTNKESYLENHKDLDTLLKELNEIKQNIEKVAEKQKILANLMSFYTGELAR